MIRSYRVLWGPETFQIVEVPSSQLSQKNGHVLEEHLFDI